MPKKTKKQKIEARHHRLQKKTEVTYSYSADQTQEHQPSPVATPPEKLIKRTPIFQDQKDQPVYFRDDLLKSLMITMIIVCVQVAIYVAQLSGTIDITNVITF